MARQSLSDGGIYVTLSAQTTYPLQVVIFVLRLQLGAVIDI